MNTATRGRRPLTLALLMVFMVTAPAEIITAQQIPDGLLDPISYREIGPTRQGGRFVNYAVPLQEPSTFYAATASGGLWKTVNHGLTFTSLLDDYEIISLGAVAVAPSDPDIVWIGTGEGNNSRSAYYGEGVWMSADAGTTWTHKGLPESHHVGRILIHPRDPDIVYVAALGHLYSENPERGLYKTTNGGSTWTKCLEVVKEGRYIGVVDVAMDPKRPNTLYAAAYDKVRRPWTFNEGGPGSGIYKSTNAGRTWTQLGGGLPGGMLGRIGISVSPQDPNVIYAIVENANCEDVPDEVRRQELLEGRPPSKRTIGNEVYRSNNAGRTWTKVNEEGSVGGSPPYYYGQIRVDPNDKEHVYNLGVGVTESVDGGKTWRRAFRAGGDNHDLWINPNDSNHMLLGHDHGMGITFDGGETWYHPDDMPLAQNYAIGIDMDYPYNVYGGLQDNGSQKGPSTSRSGGAIRFEDWFSVGGGDGMYNVVDPNDSRWLYNESQFGPIRRLDQKTGESRSIRYSKEGLRFNWCAPILISPHNSNVIYHGANILLRSPFRGESWEEISPDLSTADSSKIVGTGNIQYCVITTVDESPIVPGLIWVGTDDGNVQLTRDSGKTWTKLNDNITGNPEYWVSRVTASYHDVGTAYVTYTGLRRDDFRPFVYATNDTGKTWRSISSNLPDGSVNVIKEDRKNPDLLFVGTDKAVYVSLDRGGSWISMRNNMPYVPVHDLVIHPRENDLVVGTHGRGIFIADISPLQEMTPEALSHDAYLFEIEPKVRWNSYDSRRVSSQNFNGESEPRNTITINYFLKNDVEDVTIQIFQGARMIREVSGDTTAGLNSAAWNMRGRRDPTPEELQQLRERRQRPGMQRQQRPTGGGPGGREAQNFIEFDAQPGEYMVVMLVNGKKFVRKAVISRDHWFDK